MLDPLPPPPNPNNSAEVRQLDRASAERLLVEIPANAADPVLGGRRARALFELHHYDQAADAYWRILAKHRDDADAYLGLAWTYLDELEFGLAHQPLEAGLALRPKFEPGWRMLGDTYYQLKRYGKAVSACDRALALDPQDGTAWLYKGLSLGLDNQLRPAVVALKTATALLPTDPVPRRVRGRFLLALGEPEEAEVVLTAALRVAPGDSESRGLLMRALEAQGKVWAAFVLWWQGAR